MNPTARLSLSIAVLVGGVALPGPARAQPAPTSPAPPVAPVAPAVAPLAPSVAQPVAPPAAPVAPAPAPVAPPPDPGAPVQAPPLPAAAAPAAAPIVPEGENPPRFPSTFEVSTRSAGADPAVTRYAADLRKLTGFQKRLVFSGFFWVDTGYMTRLQGEPGTYDQSIPYMQGRFVLGASYWHTYKDWFGLAKVQFLGLVNEYAKNQYEPHTLDAYAMIGHKRWFDFQIGRFLAWEVYHRGQGIELFTAEEAGALNGVPIYWLDITRGYRNEAGQAAIHFYPHKVLKLEVAGVYGQESNQNVLGVRPVADLSVAGFKLVGGMEYQVQLPQTSADKVQVTALGVAGRAQYTVSVVTLGVNAAFLHNEAIDIQGQIDTAKSYEKTSLGGFVDIDFWRVSIGLGYHRTDLTDRRMDPVSRQFEHKYQDQAFGSLLFFLPIPGLTAKAVYGFGHAYIEDRSTQPNRASENLMHSVRLRIAYEFN